MKYAFVIFFCIIAVASLTKVTNAEVSSGEESGEDSYIQELMGEIMGAMFGCKGETNITVCKEMWFEINDTSTHNKPEYNQCKCLGSCVCKELKTMTPEGVLDNNAIQARIANITNVEMKAEATRINDACFPKADGKIDCEASFAYSLCVIEVSSEARQNIEGLVSMF